MQNVILVSAIAILFALGATLASGDSGLSVSPQLVLFDPKNSRCYWVFRDIPLEEEVMAGAVFDSLSDSFDKVGYEGGIRYRVVFFFAPGGANVLQGRFWEFSQEAIFRLMLLDRSRGVRAIRETQMAVGKLPKIEDVWGIEESKTTRGDEKDRDGRGRAVLDSPFQMTTNAPPAQTNMATSSEDSVSKK